MYGMVSITEIVIVIRAPALFHVFESGEYGGKAVGLDLVDGDILNRLDPDADRCHEHNGEEKSSDAPLLLRCLESIFIERVTQTEDLGEGPHETAANQSPHQRTLDRSDIQFGK
jgi:hypothetical protein